MLMKLTRIFILFIGAGCFTAFAAQYHLQLNTSALSGLSVPYQVDFLLQGSAGNRATFRQFNFGGGYGSFVGSSDPGVTVTSKSILLRDSATVNSAGYLLSYRNGSSLAFDLDVSNLAPAKGGTPDVVSISILDQNGNYIPIADVAAQDRFFELSLTGGTLQPQVWASTATPPFQVTPIQSPTAVPEPASARLFLLLGSFALLTAFRRRIMDLTKGR